MPMVGRGRRCPVVCERPGLCSPPACDDRCCREQEYGHRRGFRLHYGPNVSTFLSNNLQWTAYPALSTGDRGSYWRYLSTLAANAADRATLVQVRHAWVPESWYVWKTAPTDPFVGRLGMTIVFGGECVGE